MDTGGTRDIVIDRQTGLLASSTDGLADAIARLRADAELRGRLGAAARTHVEQTFAADRVTERIERLYAELADTRSAGPVSDRVTDPR
jgi:glycosyltransferase involved in cell wall biosynthesis